MNYPNSMRQRTQELRQLYLDSDNRLASYDIKTTESYAKSNPEFYEKYFKERNANLIAEHTSVRTNAFSELNRMCDEYCAKVKAFYLPNGKDITPDASIFSSGIRLTKAEALAYMEKYKGNNTMRRIIADYMEKNIPDSLTEVSMFRNEQNDIIAKAQNLLSYCLEALTSDVYADAVINKDSAFARVSSGLPDL